MSKKKVIAFTRKIREAASTHKWNVQETKYTLRKSTKSNWSIVETSNPTIKKKVASTSKKK